MATSAISNETISYIQHMLKELRILSEKEGAPVLAYLIEMAYIEANDLKDGIRVTQQNTGVSKLASAS